MNVYFGNLEIIIHTEPIIYKDKASQHDFPHELHQIAVSQQYNV